ncbi:hypothetical protein [Marinibactrum halimedae]|uniref:hypothetical protein n=1 Tax=Marinibactrum halimedae TaxID=1444977 RepID=UPI001E2C85F6|nr:hypothetical protein [Marinibactrum halimedae]MCD9459153.1 hypothetical protein [Marinibactrum halimedae]
MFLAYAGKANYTCWMKEGVDSEEGSAFVVIECRWVSRYLRALALISGIEV